MPDEKTPAWYRKWRMIIGVVTGVGVIFGMGVAARPYLEWIGTIDTRKRVTIVETAIFNLTNAVKDLTATIEGFAKERKSDEDLIKMVIIQINKENQIARNPQ